MEENMCKLNVVEDHMPPWGVAGKGKVLLSIHVKVLRKKGRWSTINLAIIIEATRAQLPKLATRVMVVVGMNPMSLKAIGRKAYLWVRSPFGLSKVLGPKRRLNIWRKEEYK
jgi:hypothetical protein